MTDIFAVLVCLALGYTSVLVDGVEGLKLIDDACASSCHVSETLLKEWRIVEASMVEREMTDGYYCCERGGVHNVLRVHRDCVYWQQADSCDDGGVVGHCDCDWLLEITFEELVGISWACRRKVTCFGIVPNYEKVISHALDSTLF